jgi:hypothetical protein
LADKKSNFEKLIKTSAIEKTVFQEGVKLYDRKN